jgi:deazaflavin-dependent oxidoreductase (nitroreductase family)
MTQLWWQAPYIPPPTEWVREQVAEYEASGGTRATTLRDTGLPVVILWTKGRSSGAVRKSPLMKVFHDGEYALVGSQGGAPTDPEWVRNLVATPTATRLQDGPEVFDIDVRKVHGEERSLWWERCVAAFAPYADYATRTTREIPVFIGSRI